MKKILSVLLAATLITALLAGCADSGKPSSKAPDNTSSVPADSKPEGEGEGEGEALSGKLVIWSHQNPAWNDSHQKLMDKFMAENPGVTIEYEQFPYMDFKQKMQTSLLSDGGGADIYEMWGGWAMDYTPTGALAKVPDSIADRMREDCYAPTLGAFTYDGSYYGMPIEYNIEYGGMLVNKPLFDQNNLTYPATWAELEKIADETSVRNGEIMDMRGFEFATGDGLTNMFLAMILSQGGTYLTGDGNQVDFSTPEAIEAMTKLVEYVKTRNWTNLDGLNAMAATDPGGCGEVFKDACMMALVGPWGVSMGEAYGKTYGTDFDYVPLPHYGEKNAFVAETGWGFGVTDKSKQKELAWKYIEWFSQPENIMEHNIACSQIPAFKSIASDPGYLEGVPYAKPIIDILDDGQYIGYINTSDLKTNIIDAFTELVTSKKFASVEAALKDVQDKVNTLNAKK